MTKPKPNPRPFIADRQPVFAGWRFSLLGANFKQVEVSEMANGSQSIEAKTRGLLIIATLLIFAKRFSTPNPKRLCAVSFPLTKSPLAGKSSSSSSCCAKEV
jgi:hypothetical protein